MAFGVSHPSSALERPVRPRRSWVPIRSLAERHCERILKHLQALSGSDRYLRFGYAATDEQVTRYVESLDFEHDEVFGIFNRRLELIAMSHLACLSTPEKPAEAEFGVSVAERARGRGYGARLFEHAVLHARNKGCERLVINALNENVAMLAIARKAGAIIQRTGPESEAWLTLPPDTLSSRMGEMVERQAAEIDYRIKAKTLRFEDQPKLSAATEDEGQGTGL